MRMQSKMRRIISLCASANSPRSIFRLCADAAGIRWFRVLAPGSKVEKLEDGFFSISGAAVDAAGKLYFVDHHEQRIFGWSKNEGLTVERDNSLDPVNLAFDRSGDLLVLSSAGPEGTVYSFHPGSSDAAITVLSPQPSEQHPALWRCFR